MAPQPTAPARPQRPGPVDKESAASGPLHHLQSELLSAKAAWDQLGTRIAKGYAAAYQKHVDTLGEMKRAKDLQSSTSALQFVLSIISVGFAGGLAGSLIGPWIKGAAVKVSQVSLRAGVTGIGQQAAKDIAKAGVKDRLDKPPDTSPYTTNSPKEIAVDLEIRDRISSAFGPILEALDDMIVEANRLQADAATGQYILNNFRQNCLLLKDKPSQDDMPSEAEGARVAELAMWVAWAQERDWSWWNPVFNVLDFWRLSPEGREQHAKNNPTFRHPMELQHVKEAVFQLNPIFRRVSALGKRYAVYDSVIQYRGYNTKTKQPIPAPISESDGLLDSGDSFFYLDLRKLRDMRLDYDIVLPFRRLVGLHEQWSRTKPLEQVKFLSSLENVKPFYK